VHRDDGKRFIVRADEKPTAFSNLEKSHGNHKLRVSERIWGRDVGPFEGNDIRIRGGVLKRCVLCGSLTRLRLSHVIPNWAFRWHKNARGGVIKIQLYSRGIVTTQQDGNKHYLLCESCEQWASVGESYALAIVDRNRNGLRARGTRYIMLDRYWRLRVDLIARFIAITALRVHYADSIPFSTTRIPLDIRKALRHVAMGRLRFDELAVSAWRFVPPKRDPDHDPRQDICEMYKEGDLGRLFIVQAGGLEWAMFFDPDHLDRTIGHRGFRGRWIERIVCLPYSEHRVFKYPEKWVPRIHAKMNSEQAG
jgi:hypothetical protein